MDNGADTAVPQGGASSPGAILAAERERQGLSRADIAQRLHMSVMQIEALELGDYERLPRGPFLRGFARNYARVLGIDAEAIVGMLTATAPPESAPRIVVPTQNIRFDPLGARLPPRWRCPRTGGRRGHRGAEGAGTRRGRVVRRGRGEGANRHHRRLP